MRLAVGEQGEGRTVEQDRDDGEVAPRRSPPWQMGLREHARDEQRDGAERSPRERQLDGGEIAQAEFDPPERASPGRGEQHEGDLPRQPVPSRGAWPSTGTRAVMNIKKKKENTYSIVYIINKIY